MPVVKMPDGQLVDMPDQPTAEQLSALQAKQAEASGPMAVVKDRFKDFVRGAGKSVGGLVTGFANSPLGGGMLRPGGNPLLSGLGESIQEGTENLLPTPANETSGGKFARKVAEGAGGAVAGPIGPLGPIKAALTGAMAGAGGEAGSRLTDGSKAGEIIGTLAGGLGGGLALAPKTTRAALARETLEGVDPAALNRAQAFMTAAEKQDIKVNLSQAMDQPSNIDAMVNQLANSKHGVNITRQLRLQPRDVSFGVENELSILPGTARQPQVVANNAQKGADAAIRSGYDQASKAWQAAAPEGSTIPPAAVQALDARLAAIAAKYPNTSGADLVNDARSALRQSTPQAQGQVGGGVVTSKMKTAVPAPKYLTDALQLKGALDDSLNTFGARKLNTPGLDATNMRRAQEVREAFRAVLDDHAPKLSAANAAYSQVMDDVVNPMKQSVVGRVAGQAGYDDAREAIKSKVFSVLDAGTTPGAKTSEILALQKALQKTDPEAFQDSIKTWMANKVSEAAVKTGGRPSENVAANLERVFTGNDVKAQGFKDMLVGLARSQNLPDNALLDGMTNMMRYVSAAARRPASVQGVSGSDLVEASTNTAARQVAGINLAKPFAQPLRALNEALNADAYRFMDRLLTSPEGIDTLRKLGKTPIMSQKAATLINTWAARQGTAPSQQPEE